MWGWLSKSLEENKVLIGIQGKNWDGKEDETISEGETCRSRPGIKGAFSRGARDLRGRLVQTETEEQQEKAEVKTGVGKGKPALFTV